MGTTTATAADKSGGVTVSVSTLVANLEGTVTGDVTGNADTATVGTTVTVSDNESTNESNVILFAAGAAGSGNLGVEADGNMTYNPSTGKITATGFAGDVTGNVTGDVTGNADTATVGTTVTVSDNESTNENNVILFAAGAAGSGNLGVEADGNMTYNPSTGKITATGFIGALTGTASLATNVTAADESSDTSCNVLFVTAATGDLPPKTGTNLTFNSSSGVLTATGFAGALTGDVTGNADTATVATTVTVSDNESTNESNVILFAAGAAGSGNLGVEADGNMTYNPSTGKITATGFIGALTGNADTATVATTVTITDNESTNENNPIVFVAGGDLDGGNLGLESDGTATYNPSTGKITATGFIGSLTGTASAAQYSDVAERFASDSNYEEGTVVTLGGAEEITITTEEASDDVFGVVSSVEQAAFKMNSDAGSDSTHPYIAMTGRVWVKITGVVNKGDRLISSATPGHARAATKAECTAFNVLGRALEFSDTGRVKAAVRVSH